jgi:hypothetical protein
MTMLFKSTHFFFDDFWKAWSSKIFFNLFHFHLNCVMNSNEDFILRTHL